ncbi:acyl-CoA dehydrogenase family protein [Kiloniella laminariae]|uniref:Acyl-CoA dehydrogenase family protein n=1 Tax=Kiloniella laminariae TaxID=454162 RepID=A0ABT4LP55_9PROT|nr:acyl-CoA dehydrogenase family protein [Kiloniella laminariae]MCZ4282909.1 acyl-CoA dehydrogenase family protein [Kiloniella laminariae]
MDMKFSVEAEAFRAEVCDFINDNLPDDIRHKVAQEEMILPREMMVRWHKILGKKGWSCPSWPKDQGGAGWSDEQHYLFEREIALSDAPRPIPYGVVMLAPCLLEFGTQAQQEKFLPGILSGDELWCQGFSEPNAGSDLASLQCRAVAEGDSYIINGSKTWTSEAHIADGMFGLFRTDSSGRKQQGITFLMIDMKTPGISVTPLMTFEGTHEVNQVFFDNVRVPFANRIGEENQGWAIAKYLLGLERFGTAEVGRSLASLGRLKKLAAALSVGEGCLRDDPDFMNEVARVEIALRALEVTEQRFLFGPGGSDAMGAEASMLKIRGTEIQQDILELTHQALGYAGQRGQDSGSVLQIAGITPEKAAMAHYNFRKTSIYAGSNEIQKTIIAKAVLGL